MSSTLERNDQRNERFDFTKSANQMLIIEAVRLGFLWTILIILIAFGTLQPEFINVEIMVPIYIMLASAFILNSVYLLYFEQALKTWLPTAILFLFDTVFITCLNYYNGANQSVFVFLYLVNIILCGFVFRSRGALFLALATSVAFNILIIVGPELKGQTLFFSVGLNNLAFYAVALLSGYLSDQLNFMGSELVARGRDIKALKNLNDLIIQNIATGLISINSKLDVLMCNRAATTILEVDAKDLVGHNLEEIMPGMAQFISSHEVELKQDRSTRFDFGYTNMSRDKLNLEFIISPLIQADGISDSYVLAFQDLTVVRRLEFAVRQSEKLAAVGQLAAGIAHEIRNPLASISGSIELLGQGGPTTPDEQKKLMNIVIREIDRLNNMITEFLDYVKPNQINDESVQLSGLLGDICEMNKMNKNLRQDTEVTLDLSSKKIIAGSRDKLRQALINIIINAHQAVTEQPHPKVKVSCTDGDKKVIVRISDNGVGIEEARLKKIFEPFHTTKAKGTGLGLAVTHKILEAHSAQIFVESQKGVGTEFILEFPERTERNDLPLAQTKIPEDNLTWGIQNRKAK